LRGRRGRFGIPVDAAAADGPATKPASVIGAVPDLLIMRDAKPGWLLLGL